MSAEIRVLRPGDEALLFPFLEARIESSLFLLSNAELGGLEDRGERLQGTYAARIEDGAITAVASLSWTGNLLVQGDLGLEEAARLAVERAERPVKGIIGPLELVRRTRTALGFDTRAPARDLEDRLFVLELERLVVPALLSDPDIALRVATESEVDDTLGEWRTAYHEEVLGAVRTPDLEERAHREMHGARLRGDGWVLVRRGELVAYTGLNAETRGIVQVGGVYTPPRHRRNGYARAAVAASLLLARARGCTKSTLFTGEDNAGAIRAYTALGYEPRGEFGLLLFR